MNRRWRERDIQEYCASYVEKGQVDQDSVVTVEVGMRLGPH